MHTESSYCQNHESSRYSSSVFVSVPLLRDSLIIYLQVSLTSSVAGTITGVYCFQADDVTELNNRKMYIAVGVSACQLRPPVFNMLTYTQIWCGASALCDIIIAICMTYYVSSCSLSVISIDIDMS